MSELKLLIDSIVATCSDYHIGEASTFNAQHVETWINQFNDESRVLILKELDNVLKKTYFSLARVEKFLNNLITTSKVAGQDPVAFWSSSQVLKIQKGGSSQLEMLAIFEKLMLSKIGIPPNYGKSLTNTFVYIDDGIFTGNRLLNDLRTWISKDAPVEATVIIVSIGLHCGGYYYAKGKLDLAAAAAKKNITFKWRYEVLFEDRLTYIETSDVLRPSKIPDHPGMQDYIDAMTYKPRLRVTNQLGGQGVFSSSEGRNLLEQEFLKNGISIIKGSPNLGNTQRPLGHSTLETLGFGSLIVTFRNCPNNAPLVFWVGYPWYPLFPRMTNSQSAIKRFIDNLKIT